MSEVTCISEIHGVVKIAKMDSSNDDTICPKPSTTTVFPIKSTTKKSTKPIRTKSTKSTTTATTTTFDGVFTVDKDYMDEDDMLEEGFETTTTITTMSTTEPELYALPTMSISPTSILTKISPTLQSINVLTTTKSILDGDSFYDDSGFMSYVSKKMFKKC